MKKLNLKGHELFEKVELHSSAMIQNGELILPIQKRYYLQARLHEDLRFGPIFRISTNPSFHKDPQALTPEQAISEFILSNSNDNIILSLYSDPERVDFKLYEMDLVYFTDFPFTIDGKLLDEGESLKEKLRTDPNVLIAKEEIERARSYAERQEKIEDEKRQEDKNYSFYNQWKWLEAKRLEGQFDKFMKNENVELETND